MSFERIYVSWEAAGKMRKDKQLNLGTINNQPSLYIPVKVNPEPCLQPQVICFLT
jgi:hypothetical protein